MDLAECKIPTETLSLTMAYRGEMENLVGLDRRKNTKVFRSTSEASLLFRGKNGAPEGVWCLCADF